MVWMILIIYCLKVLNKNYVPIMKDDVEYKIRAGRLDNRKDLTSDFRKPESEWTQKQKDDMFNALKDAFDSLLG